jgi:copper chaperone CopZ
LKAEVLFNSSRVKADIDERIVSIDQVKQRIEALGYKVLGEK